MPADFDPDYPGCAPEMCGGMRLDPCVTIMRTRGRWHDGEVPETAAHAEIAEAKRHVTGRSKDSMQCVCGYALVDLEQWALHVAAADVAAVADWLRAQPVQLQLRDPQKHGYTNAARWAAGLLDGRSGL